MFAQRAIDCGHADEAPMAAIALGLLLAEQGDVEGAKAAFEQAIASGHPKWAPRGQCIQTLAYSFQVWMR